MTANVMAGDRERCLSAGMNDYVSKPIRVKLLVEALTRAGELALGQNGSESAAGQVPDEETAAAPSTAGETLDSAALNNLLETVGGDQEFLAELVDTFLEDAPQMLADMRQAAETGDAPGLRLAAHSLKSNSADFGAMSLNALCKQLEILGKENQLDGALPLIEQADAAFEAVKPALLALQPVS